MTNTILTSFTYIIQLFLFYYYILVMSEITLNVKHNKKDKYIILLCSSMMTFSGVILRGLFPINTIIMLIILSILLKFILKIKTAKTILITVILPCTMIILEILVASVFIFIIHMSPEVIINNIKVNFTVNIIISIMLFVLIQLFYRILINKKKINDFLHCFNNKYLKIFTVVILFNFAPQAILIPINKYNYSVMFLTLSFLQLITTSVFLFWYISNFLEKEKTKEQLQLLEMDHKTLVGMVDGVRTIKHDFNNIFQAINGYISTKQYEDLDKYVLKIMKECNFVNTLSIINREIFDDPANYGVIGSKYFVATENNITMDLDVTVSFKDINFPMAELSRILGILLDNAIEATKKCENQYIRLEIKYVPKKNSTVIRIINTYDTSKQISLTDIYNKGYSTKKIKSGIGLWETKKIVCKYKHSQIYATIENDRFVQNIIIENA